MSVDWAAVGTVIALGVPVAGAAVSTWLRSRRNTRKLDALLSAFGIDPSDPPEYDIDPTAVRADGGEEQ